jgi:hypothetical protein
MGAVAFAPIGLAAELSYEVWHGHPRPPHIRKAGNTGTLVVSDSGISLAHSLKADRTALSATSASWCFCAAPCDASRVASAAFAA